MSILSVKVRLYQSFVKLKNKRAGAFYSTSPFCLRFIALLSGCLTGFDPKNTALRTADRSTTRNLSGLYRKTDHELQHLVTFQREVLAQLCSKLITSGTRTVLGNVSCNLSAQLSTKRTLTGFLGHFTMLSYLSIGFLLFVVTTLANYRLGYGVKIAIRQAQVNRAC